MAIHFHEEDLPEGVNPEMGPIATGLGDIFMWTVEYRELDQVHHRNGEPGLQRDASYITPEGDHLVSDADKATYLRTVQDWIVTPQLKSTAGLAGVDSLGGYTKEYRVIPDIQRMAAMRLTLQDLTTALQRSNTSAGAGVVALANSRRIERN